MVSWHLNYYFFGRGTPISAGVYINDVCNYKCTMCDIRMKEEPTVYPREVQERDIDVLSKMGLIYYSISGGEPTLVKDLSERLAYAAKKIPYVHLVTNGSTMTVDLAKRLGQTGMQEISVSIDGLEEFHNIMRGVPNAFEKAWNALHLLVQYAPKVEIVVNSILTPYNLDSLRGLKKKLSVNFPKVYIKYLPETQHELFLNHGQKSFSCEGMESATFAQIEVFLAEAIKDPKIVNSSSFLRKILSYFSGEKDLLGKQKKCLYPYFSLQFNAQGAAYPCLAGCHSEEIQTENNLQAYIDSAAFLKLQNKLETCKKCRGNMMLCYYEPRLNFPLHNLVLEMFR
jgi:MoaA/NifB/PqqE/SkfB family radical SAM enzyme